MGGERELRSWRLGGSLGMVRCRSWCVSVRVHGAGKVKGGCCRCRECAGWNGLTSTVLMVIEILQ